LPGDTPQDVVDVYTAAFASVQARSDFAKISAKRLGKYPMYVGADAKAALDGALQISPDAKAYVIGWLKDKFGVSLN